MHCVLITGATGVIGSELVPLFLDDQRFQVRLLLRAAGPEHLDERVAELHRYWQRDRSERLEAVAGDVCHPRLGLDEAAYARLAGEVTHVVHSAGNVRLDRSLDEARRHAVEPARNLVGFARACRAAGKLQKFDAVSTIGVAGRMPGLIPERPLTEPREFHNTYEQAKAEAEAYLFDELAAGLPVTIHRPSMVVERSDTGRVYRKQVFYYLARWLTGERTFGFVPEFGDATLDLVPVDHVARAIYLSAIDPATVGRVFHLCAGPERAARFDDLVAQLRREAAATGRRLPRLRHVPLRWFRRVLPLLTSLSWGRTRRALRSLPYFLSYLEQRQAFDVRETEAWLAARRTA